jgi:hypothetical protein
MGLAPPRTNVAEVVAPLRRCGRTAQEDDEDATERAGWPAGCGERHGGNGRSGPGAECRVCCALVSSDVAADFSGDGVTDLAVDIPGGEHLCWSGERSVRRWRWAKRYGAQLFTQMPGTPRLVIPSAQSWRPGTSTMTGSRTWPPAPPARRSAAPWMPAQSVCCRARSRRSRRSALGSGPAGLGQPLDGAAPGGRSDDAATSAS